jgi:SAM-dependent methyltransferase
MAVEQLCLVEASMAPFAPLEQQADSPAANDAPNDDAARFDFDRVFDENYLYFYAPTLTDKRSDGEADAIRMLLDLQPGEELLDLGCGHGRISNRLAQRGARVTGLDASEFFLDHARKEAAAMNVEVTYVPGDMRAPPWTNRFDAAISWYTTFGYFDQAGNEQTLRNAAAALKPGGRLLIDQLNRAALLREGVPHTNIVRCGQDVMVDTIDYDGRTDRRNTNRLIVRDGKVSQMNLSIRLYSAVEFSQMLYRAGFSRVATFGRNGEPFALYGPRLVVVAYK